MSCNVLMKCDRITIGMSMRLPSIARKRGEPLASGLLRQPQVTSALVGASSVGQLVNTLKALDNAQLDAEALARIDALASG